MQGEKTFTETTEKATEAVNRFNVAIIQSQIEDMGLEDALREYLGTAGQEIDDAFMRRVHFWEEAAGAKVTLHPGWRFSIEKLP